MAHRVDESTGSSELHEGVRRAVRRLAAGAALGASESLSDLGEIAGGQIEALRCLERLRDDFAAAQQPTASEPQSRQEVRWTWGHLEVRELLGQGGFGRVYRAFDPLLQREVALKLPAGLRHISSSTSDQPTVARPLLSPVSGPGAGAPAQRAFIDEARRMARVRHPNVLAVHGADLHDGEVGLWTDLIEGPSLEGLLAEDVRRPPDSWLPRFEELAQGLAAVHRADLVHGDIKASNVLLDGAGTAVLADFGAGRQCGDDLAQAAGSPLTSAPEVLTGEPASQASDVWSLGSLWFRCLNGAYPVAAEDWNGLVEAYAERRTLPWKERCPRGLRRLVEHMLAPEAEGRPDANRVLEALRYLRAAPLRRRRRLAMTMVVSALTLGLVLASLGLRRSLEAERRTRLALGSERAAAQFMIGWMEEADANRAGGQSVTLTDLLDAGAERVQAELGDQPRVQMQLYLVLARLERQQNRLDRAGEHLERAEALLIWAADRAAARSELAHERGLVAYARGDYDRAVIQLEAALQTLVADDQPLRSAQTLKDLSLAVRARGEYLRAEHLAREALGQLDRPVSPGSPVSPATSEARSSEAEWMPRAREEVEELRAEITYHLGVALYLQRDYPAARALVVNALGRYRAVHGANHLLVAQALNRLGLIAKREGQHEVSLRRFRESLAVARPLLGEAHPEVAMTVANVGNIYTHLGRYAEAESSLRQAIASFERSVGAEHPDLAIPLNNLIQTLKAQNRSGEAEPLARRVLSIWSAAHGTSHPYVALAWSNLGAVLRRIGDLPGAVEAGRTALETECGLEQPQLARLQGYAAELRTTWLLWDQQAEVDALAVAAEAVCSSLPLLPVGPSPRASS